MKSIFCLLMVVLTTIQLLSAQVNLQKVTLSKTNATYQEIISELEKKTGLLFSYEPSLFPKGRHYDIKESNQPVKEVLEKWLTPVGIQAVIRQDQVILKLSGVKKKYTLSGIIRDQASGETVIGASIRVIGSTQGAVSNAYGFYSLTLDENQYDISITYLGYSKEEFQLDLTTNAERNVFLHASKSATGLKEVQVRTTKSQVKEYTGSTEMGKLDIPIGTLRKVPSIAGENDIVKVLQMTPGVKRGGEGHIGMYVRGGGADENLILLDEATVYNAGHLLGFFSVFNSQALKDVQLYKSGFPSSYGGRLSSILDIRMREGNKKQFKAEASVGLISSNLTVEGPIWKNKISFIVSGRRTYIDQLFSLVKLPLPYYFYDVNAKVNWDADKRNKFYLSSYVGNDVLKVDDIPAVDSTGDINPRLGSQIGNFTTTFRWNHIFKNQQLFVNTTLLQTRFRYYVEGAFTDNSIKLESSIRDYGAKMDFNYYPNPSNRIRFGAEVINHTFRPNTFITRGSVAEEDLPDSLRQRINTTESALYALNDWDVSTKLRINYGARLSSALTQNTMYGGLEPRISLRYQMAKAHSLKASYTRMKQYMHLVSSSSVSLPTDLWYPVTKTVSPMRSDQLSLGYYTGIDKLNLTFSTELYYKKLDNIVEYKEGAVLVMNNNFEKELVRGQGDAYGIEFFLNKTAGRFTGWIGYTLSYSNRQFDSLNHGKRYYAKYDRRHDLSIVAMYDLGKRVSISGVWVYATGNPFTARIGQYVMPSPGYNGIVTVPIYSDRNAYRLSPSHRLDLDLCIKRKPQRKWGGEWHFSAYNVYNRPQPYRVKIKQTSSGTQYQQKGLFGLLPSISYQVKI